MATQYAAGGRRSAAPTFQLATPQGTAVTNLMRAFTMPTAAPAPVQPVARPTAPAQSQAQPRPSSGSYNNASFTGAPQASFQGTTNPMNSVRAIQALAMLTGNPEAAKLAGTVGTVGQVATAQSPGQVAMALAPTLASKLGVPGGVLGLGMAAAKQDAGMAVDAGLALANPMLGTLNALSKAVLGSSIGTAVNNTVQDYGLGKSLIGPDAGMFDSIGIGNEINSSPDPLGDFLGALDASKPATETRGSGNGGFGRSGSFGRNNSAGTGSGAAGGGFSGGFGMA